MPLRLTIEFETPLHHGSGFGLAGIVDRAVLRDERGMPYLAGSAVKGKFRYAAARLLLGTGREVCGPWSGRDLPWCVPPESCLLCEIFGSPRRAGKALFEDAYPAMPEQAILRSHHDSSVSKVFGGGSDVRASTAIDRYYRRARPEHLFSTETISPMVRFEATIRGNLSEEEKQVLVSSATLIAHFGADSSRGLGICRCQVSEVAV